MFFLQMVVRVHLLPRGLGVPRYQNKRIEKESYVQIEN